MEEILNNKDGKRARYVLGSVLFFVVLFVVLYYMLKTDKEYVKYWDLYVLSYGDSCDPEPHIFNGNWTYSVLQLEIMNDQISPYLICQLDELSCTRKYHPLCNPYEHLTCNPKTNLCDCGDPALEFLSGEEASTRMFVVERDVNPAGYSTGRHCRARRNTFCSFEDETMRNFTSEKGIKLDMGCETGTSCKGVNSKRACNESDFKSYFEQYGRKTAVEGYLAGKICSCQHDNEYIGKLEVLH